MSLSLERLSPTSVRVTRRFTAPPAQVWAAHTEPDRLRRWLLGPEGWAMTVCEVDYRAGGRMFLRWEHESGAGGFDLRADILDVTAPNHSKHVEVMYLPDPTPPNTVETRFDPDGDGTLMTMTMTVETAATMDAMLATGMTDGMELSYRRLDGLP